MCGGISEGIEHPVQSLHMPGSLYDICALFVQHHLCIICASFVHHYSSFVSLYNANCASFCASCYESHYMYILTVIYICIFFMYVYVCMYVCKCMHIWLYERMHACVCAISLYMLVIYILNALNAIHLMVTHFWK